jgi:hypothetical protein
MHSMSGNQSSHQIESAHNTIRGDCKMNMRRFMVRPTLLFLPALGRCFVPVISGPLPSVAQCGGWDCERATRPQLVLPHSQKFVPLPLFPTLSHFTPKSTPRLSFSSHSVPLFLPFPNPTSPPNNVDIGDAPSRFQCSWPSITRDLIAKAS